MPSFTDQLGRTVTLDHPVAGSRRSDPPAFRRAFLVPHLIRQPVLLSSEPYPFRDKHREELQALLPHATIRLVDGEMFSWYGSRLLLAPAYFQNLISELPSHGFNR